MSLDDKLDDLIREDERARAAAKERRQSLKQWFRSRYRPKLILTEEEGLVRLTFDRVVHPVRQVFGLASLASATGLLCFYASLGEPWLLMVSVPLVVLGVALMIFRKTTFHIVGTAKNFALYTKNPDKPRSYGEASSIGIMHYEWRGRLGVLIRAYTPVRWEQTYMDIKHPDDFATMARFKHAWAALKGRSRSGLDERGYWS